MKKKHKKRQASGAIAGVLAVAAAGAAIPATARAQTGAAQADVRQQTKRFAIAPGPLDSALAAFSRTTGIVITDPGAVAAGARSEGVVGNLTLEDALFRLLSGTGVTYRFTNVRALRIERGVLPEPAASRTAMLETVTTVGTRTPISSSTKYTEPLSDVPQTVTVVSKEVLEAQGATSLRDAIKNVPGITINAGEGGSPPGDNFNVRGFSARSDLFVDGVRDIGGYSRDAFNLEQVEVAEGPGSAFTGRGSTGGSINMVTKTPHLGADRTVVATGSSASHGRGSADINQPLDALGLGGAAIRVNAMWGGGDVAGNDTQHNKAWGVAPSIAFGLSSSTQALLSYSRTGQDNLPAYGLTTWDSVPHVDTRHFFGLPSLDFEHVNASELTARVDHQHGAWHLREQLTRGASTTGRIVTTAAANTGARSSKTHRSDDEILTSQTSVTTSVGNGPVVQDIAAGVEIARERSMFGHYTIDGTPPAVQDFEHPDPALDYHPDVTLAPNPRRVIANSVGAYLFDTFKFGRHIEVSAGGRWDRFDPTFTDSVSHDIPSASMFSGRLGVVAKPTDDVSVYAAYGTSFDPAIQNLSYDRLNTLPPEESRSVEIGTKWSALKQRILATFALFRTDKTNARTPDPNDPSVNILAGRQRVQGAEVSATGSITRRWSVMAGYTHLESKVLASGTEDQVGAELVNTPKHSANLWTTYQLPEGFEVGGGARYVGRRFLRYTTYVPGYKTFDAEVSKELGQRVGLRLNVYNLSNELYYDNGRFWVPAPARSAALTTTVHF